MALMKWLARNDSTVSQAETDEEEMWHGLGELWEKEALKKRRLVPQSPAWWDELQQQVKKKAAHAGYVRPPAIQEFLKIVSNYAYWMNGDFIKPVTIHLHLRNRFGGVSLCSL